MSRPDSTPTDLEAELHTLRAMNREDLIRKFRKIYRKEAPPRLSTHILALAIAYRLQEDAYGGLKPAIRRALLTGSTTIFRSASPGTVLIREWHGQNHTVTVHSDRVEYAGNRFRSLTEVVFQITGQKRSGPAFFGLRRPARG